jgi:hypothetical protein
MAIWQVLVRVAVLCASSVGVSMGARGYVYEKYNICMTNHALESS